MGQAGQGPRGPLQGIPAPPVVIHDDLVKGVGAGQRMPGKLGDHVLFPRRVAQEELHHADLGGAIGRERPAIGQPKQ
ncbi:hypothetical protein RZS08_46505, partial [Arthrospira platensis SPKY1]|nr:hypothetical protein [Arthrospira platensis SPKY1]